MSTTPQLAFPESFDLIRIINLPSRADRREETVSEFSAHGFASPLAQGQFFPAISPEDAGGFPNRGVRGCYLSHLAILRQARDAGAHSVLILEDDIAFTRDIGKTGPLAIDQLSTQAWDIAYFGHALGSTTEPPHWKPVSEPMLLAHCYAVNGQVLGKIVEFLEAILARPPGHPDGGPMHFDGALNTFIQQQAEIKALYFSKNLGYQRPSRTDLHRTSILDRNKLLRPFAGAYRLLKRSYLKYRF